MSSNKNPVIVPGVFDMINALCWIAFLGSTMAVLFGVLNISSGHARGFGGYIASFGGGIAMLISGLGMLMAELGSVLFKIEANTRSTHEVLHVACKSAAAE